MNCNRCSNKAVYTRKYSGESLCSDCFSDSIIRKTAKTISKHNMIKNQDNVCVAVSGGKDSLALLYVLNKMKESHNFEISPITIDEGIAGYREEALKIVADFCSQLNLRHQVYSYKDLYDLSLEEALKDDDRTSSCSICGTLRRRAIDYAANDVGANVIATAHNLDDNLQTFLINMISGDTKKVGWMDPDNSGKSKRKIKPFCEIYESEIVFFAFTNNLPFQTEPCPHMNEGIRTEIREFLNSIETNHSGIKNNLYKSIQKISQIVNQSDTSVRSKCMRCGNPCTGNTCSVCKMILSFRD